MNTETKAQIGMGMEGRVAKWYAKTTGKDMAEFQRLAERLAPEIPPNGRVLEIAPGPGYLAIELAKRGVNQITGLDISKTLVEIAQENARREGVVIDFQRGNASAMPFPDDMFDYIVCRAAFKNFAEPLEALNEMQRVLKPGGCALIIDLNKEVSMTDIGDYIRHSEMGWLDGLMVKMVFRCMLIPRAYTAEQFRALASRSKFGKCDIVKTPLSLEITLKTL